MQSAVNSYPISLRPHELVSHPYWNCTRLDPVYVTATAVMSEVTVVSRKQHFIAPLSSIALTSFLPHLLQCSLRLGMGVIKKCLRDEQSQSLILGAFTNQDSQH